MEGKYESWRSLSRAYAIRQLVRVGLRHIVSWVPLENPIPGCTAIIGMCHRLPDVLICNLRCLSRAAWPELQKVIIIVDAESGCVSDDLLSRARRVCSNLELQFVYYSRMQSRLAEVLRLPYVFSWLSWSIALSHCQTAHVLIHDYDALVFGEALARRYREFVNSGARIQGIRWYDSNGVTPSDRLATTFEAFVDAAWIRSHPPIAGFNQVGYSGGRSRDYDTYLQLQHTSTPIEKRTVSEMTEEELVHPSQMIHQFTMFRRYPGGDLPCFSIPMIPFFAFLSGNESALIDASTRLQRRGGMVLDFLGDSTLVNLQRLDTPQVNWALKQMVRACMGLGIEPIASLWDYGVQLYRAAATPEKDVWVGDFTASQRQWIEAASTLAAAKTGNARSC